VLGRVCKPVNRSVAFSFLLLLSLITRNGPPTAIRRGGEAADNESMPDRSRLHICPRQLGLWPRPPEIGTEQSSQRYRRFVSCGLAATGHFVLHGRFVVYAVRDPINSEFVNPNRVDGLLSGQILTVPSGACHGSWEIALCLTKPHRPVRRVIR
jgi:hypothetical protein